MLSPALARAIRERRSPGRVPSIRSVIRSRRVDKSYPTEKLYRENQDHLLCVSLQGLLSDRLRFMTYPQ